MANLLTVQIEAPLILIYIHIHLRVPSDPDILSVGNTVTIHHYCAHAMTAFHGVSSVNTVCLVNRSNEIMSSA